MKIDRTDPLMRDDPVLSRLTDEQAEALIGLIVRLARSRAAQIAADTRTESDDPLD